MSSQQFPGALSIRPAAPCVARMTDHCLECVEMRYHEIVNVGLADIGAVDLDQHVYDGLPVTIIRELAVLACLGASDIGMDHERVPLRQPRHYPPGRCKQRGDHEVQASLASQC